MFNFNADHFPLALNQVDTLYLDIESVKNDAKQRPEPLLRPEWSSAGVKR
jgi:hypothetical protein